MEQLKKIKWDVIGTSAILTALGIILIIFPAAVNEMIVYVLAAGMFLLSGISFYNFFNKKTEAEFYRNDLVFAVATLVIAIVILTKKQELISLVPIVFGIFIIISGVKKLQNAIDIIRLKLGGWIPVMVLAAINLIFGIIMICNSSKAATVITVLIGVGLAFSGLSDIFATLWVSGRAKKILKRMPVSSPEKDDDKDNDEE